MANFYFSVNLDNDRTLCVAPLTNRKIAMAGVEVPDPSGYFLFRQRPSKEFGGVENNAQVFWKKQHTVARYVQHVLGNHAFLFCRDHAWRERVGAPQ